MTTPPQEPQQPGQQPGQQRGQGPVYGQAGHFGQLGDHVPPPPPKERHPLPWLLGGAGVLVVAAVVVLVVVLTGGTDTGSAKGVNDAVVAAINDKDANALKDLLCHPDIVPRELDQGLTLAKDLADVEASAKGDPVQRGDTATSTIRVKVSALGQTMQADLELTFKQHGDAWCVDAMTPKVGG